MLIIIICFFFVPIISVLTALIFTNKGKTHLKTGRYQYSAWNHQFQAVFKTAYKPSFLNGKYRDINGLHTSELLSNRYISQMFKLQNSSAFIFYYFAHQHYLTTNVTCYKLQQYAHLTFRNRNFLLNFSTPCI